MRHDARAAGPGTLLQSRRSPVLTISPAIDAYGYSKELGLWNLKIINNTDNAMDLAFRIQLVAEGRSESGEQKTERVTLTPHPETSYWRDTVDPKPIVGRVHVGPRDRTESDAWLVFPLPDGEAASLSNNYTQMSDIWVLEVTGGVTNRSKSFRFPVGLDDWPLVRLSPPDPGSKSSQTTDGEAHRPSG